MKGNHKYSGRASSNFWKRINSIPGRQGELLYVMGVMLQNTEVYVLCELEAAEAKLKRTRSKGGN
jgi:hypothetical protein